MQKIVIRPSLQLALTLLLAHVAAAAVSAMADMPAWAYAAVVTAIALSLGQTLYRSALLQSREAIVTIEFGEGGALSFQTRDGEWHKADVLETSFVSACLTILNLKTRDARFARHVVLTPDSIADEEFRRLRVWLRWRKEPGSNKRF